MAQDDVPFEADASVVQYEDYLEERGLRDVLGAHLRQRIAASSGAARMALAERLGALYVELLGEARTADARESLEAQSRELLRLVPESETYELRINLAKVTYLRAEEIAERDRLRLATPEDRAEAVRILKGVGPTFEEIARKVQSQIDALERQERDATDDVLPKLREDLAKGSRARSLARYYSGWTAYYLALLGANAAAEAGEGVPRLSGGEANKALENFGWILQAPPGRAPSIAQIPKTLLGYEHVARAVIGTAMTVALQGEDIDAIRWLDELERAEELNPKVKAQLFTRRLIIYAGAGRWTDAEFILQKERQPDRTVDAIPMSPPDARLAAVLGLEALRSQSGKLLQREAAERVAQAGLGDLVARGEVSQVLDLVARYGTAPIGGTGFIVQYIQGLQVYEQARERHKEWAVSNGADADEPATDAGLINAYRQGAELLGQALVSGDAPRFESEAARALMRRGFALYYAGDLEEAAKEFQRSHEAAKLREARQDALWFAIVSLDRAVDGGRPSLAKERDRLAILYLRQFPETEEAAKLLLRQSQAELLSDEETLRILMAMTSEQPLYDAARRQAARVLYRMYRRASAADKPFAALRFAEVAEELLRAEAVKAQGVKSEEGGRAAQSVMLLVRQLADALLSSSTPDVRRVEGALQLLETIAATQGLDVAPIEAEMNFRRLQLALAKGDAGEIERSVLRLRQNGGEFALAGERLMYRRALDAWRASPEDSARARQVVRHGESVLSGVPNAKDPALTPVRVSVASAAAKLWTLETDRAMRDLAIRLDKESIESGGKTLEVLRRLGELSEAAGDEALALRSWQELFAALPEATAEWFEARYQSLRLLWATDQAAGFEAMRQFKALYPQLGEEPWRAKLRQLDEDMRGFTPAGAGAPGAAGGRAGDGSGSTARKKDQVPRKDGSP